MKNRTPKGVLGALSVLAAGALLLPAAASAGGYDVSVCKNGKANAAMTAGQAPGYEPWNLIRTTNNCDGGWNGWNGISVSVTNGPETPANDVYVAQNTSANILAAAPPGAGIRKIHVDSGRMATYYGNTTGWNARVMVPSLGWCRTDGLGGNWCGMGWQAPADNSAQAQWGAADYPGYTNRDIGPINGEVSSLTIGVVCNGGSSWSGRPCYRATQKPSAGVAVASADIQVVDNTKPVISPLSGAIADGQWHKPGPIAYGVEAWDNTGIRLLTKYVDDSEVGSTEQPCDYGKMRPCEDARIAATPDTVNAKTDTVNVTGYDGFHTVTLRARSASQYWLDCNVDCADASATVAIDGTAPGAPASKNNSPAWSNANSFALTAPLPASENDPDGAGPQARSPIARRVVTICPADASSSSDSRCKYTDAPVPSGQSPASAAINVPSEGAWTARVQLVDTVGNVGAQSAPVSVRFDKTPPVASVKQAPDAFTIVSTDPLSGPANFTYRVDGKGGWITGTGTLDQNRASASLTVPASVGQHNIEVKPVDNAGNASSVQTFTVTVLSGNTNVTTLDDFNPDSQVAVVDRGAINGAGGGEKATLTAWFVKRSKSKKSKNSLSVRTIGEHNSASIEGLLVDGAGKGISGARVDLGAAIAGGRTEIKKGAATTDSDGNFSIKLLAGQTSRDLTVAYMARVNDTRPAASAGLRLIVKARASLTAHNPRVGRVKFTGFVSSGYLTKAGVRVEIQWWNPKAREWDPFGSVRTNQNGRWTWKRLFTERATYRMRAFVPSTPAYAYKGAASRTKIVRIR
jgi:hypothetical protein